MTFAGKISHTSTVQLPVPDLRGWVIFVIIINEVTSFVSLHLCGGAQGSEGGGGPPREAFLRVTSCFR